MFAELYDGLGEAEAARRCRELAASAEMFKDGYQVGPIAGLAEHGVPWFLADPDSADRMEQAAAERSADDRTDVAVGRLMADPGFFESLLPRPAGLRSPALLVVGASDLVASPDQVQALRDSVVGGRVEVFERSAHFPQFEQPHEYTDLVTDFVVLHANGERAQDPARTDAGSTHL